MRDSKIVKVKLGKRDQFFSEYVGSTVTFDSMY